MIKATEKSMTTEELRAINPEDYEGRDIAWDNGTPGRPDKFIGRVLFDYDQGLSILEKDNSEVCLTSFHGPAYKGETNYETEEIYNQDLTRAFKMLKYGYYDGQFKLACLAGKYRLPFFGTLTCSFT